MSDRPWFLGPPGYRLSLLDHHDFVEICIADMLVATFCHTLATRRTLLLIACLAEVINAVNRLLVSGYHVQVQVIHLDRLPQLLLITNCDSCCVWAANIRARALHRL